MKLRKVGDRVAAVKDFRIKGDFRPRIRAGEVGWVLIVKSLGCFVQFANGRRMNIDNATLDSIFKTTHPRIHNGLIRCPWADDDKGCVLDWNGGECPKILALPGYPHVSCPFTREEAQARGEGAFHKAVQELDRSNRELMARVESSPEFKEWLASLTYQIDADEAVSIFLGYKNQRKRKRRKK